jgi:hypothetical protein
VKRRYAHLLTVDREDGRVLLVVRGRAQHRHLATLRMLPAEARQLARSLVQHAKKGAL